MRTVGLAAALMLCLGAPGCGARGLSRAPERSVRAFADALREGDLRSAHHLLAAEYRAQTSVEEMRQILDRNPSEREALIALLSRPTGEPEITAEVTYGDGQVLHLVFEDGRWRIDGNVFDFYDQSTPRAALRSFVRAIERRRYDIVLRFVPEADREGMTAERLREVWEGPAREEIARLVTNLKASLDNPIEQTGDHATMAYGGRFTVEFVFEDGVWRIADPD